MKNKEIRGTVGAVIMYSQCACALTAGHVIRYGNGAVGTKVIVDGYDSTVVRLLNDYDLALIDVPPEHATLSVIGRASFGPAELITYDRHIDCRVVDTGRNLNRFAFPCADMPLPGDSGAPIVQQGAVIGLLSSILYNNCTGLGISSEVFGNPSRLK
ncbi:MAG TPA: serine protease [Candidatus Bathyarchaeia archaeon]|nr:serine protease [Candidatus Bathyarchaeia archaeon]